jgi:hypothetical protein
MATDFATGTRRTARAPPAAPFPGTPSSIAAPAPLRDIPLRFAEAGTTEIFLRRISALSFVNKQIIDIAITVGTKPFRP